MAVASTAGTLDGVATTLVFPLGEVLTLLGDRTAPEEAPVVKLIAGSGVYLAVAARCADEVASPVYAVGWGQRDRAGTELAGEKAVPLFVDGELVAALRLALSDGLDWLVVTLDGVAVGLDVA